MYQPVLNYINQFVLQQISQVGEVKNKSSLDVDGMERRNVLFPRYTQLYIIQNLTVSYYVFTLSHRIMLHHTNLYFSSHV